MITSEQNITEQTLHIILEHSSYQTKSTKYAMAQICLRKYKIEANANTNRIETQIQAFESRWFLFREYLLCQTPTNPRYQRYKSLSSHATIYILQQMFNLFIYLCLIFVIFLNFVFIFVIFLNLVFYICYIS